MSQANLYGFGRLAWSPDLSSRQIAEEWTRLTFGSNPKVVKTITDIQLTSWRTYENYTGPLGLQTLTDIVGNHYGVAVEASERNGWGQWHRADTEGEARGVGMDRTVATGTGFIGQYTPAVARMYESLATCPDDLLLFMHHVPYTHVLHSGKTVIQYLYDSHYEGAEAVEGYVRDWKLLQGRVDDRRYQEVLAQLEYQAGQAEVWRDAVSNWFQRASGIPDAKGRVGNHPGRIEAESAKLEGYKTIDVTPWETASGGKAVECTAAQCAANFGTAVLQEYFRFECAISIPTAAYRIFAPSSGTGFWMNGLRAIVCLLAKSTARHPRFTSLTGFRSRKEPRSVSKEHRTVVRRRRSITSKSGNYLPWHLPPGQRLFSSQTYSYNPAASHSGFAAISNGCDHAAVKTLGSSIVRLYESVFGFFQEIRSMVLSASLCIRYSLGLV